MSSSIVSEYWYAISQIGKVINKGASKESVLSEEAFYYIRRFNTKYNTTKYFIFNTVFEPTTMKYNGIVGTDTEFTVKAARPNVGGDRLRFYLKDKTNQMLRKDFEATIESFSSCIQFMEELGNYGSLIEMTLTQKVDILQDEKQVARDAIVDLEAKNKKLQAQLDDFYNSRNDLRRLTQLLFENDKSNSVTLTDTLDK